jgi:ubiquinone/menaquinone biosynthesis C-methylase UbiE
MSVVNRKPNKLAIDALKIGPSDRVLELGFGPGWAVRRTAALASQGKIYGVDQSATMLAEASYRNRAAIRRGQIELQQRRWAELPFANESFDKILAVNVAYFFSHDGSEFREAKRVLRRGGLMAVYVSDRATLARWPFAQEDTHRAYELDELITTARYGGFAMDEISISAVTLPFSIAGFLATLQKQHV